MLRMAKDLDFCDRSLTCPLLSCLPCFFLLSSMSASLSSRARGAKSCIHASMHLHLGYSFGGVGGAWRCGRGGQGRDKSGWGWRAGGRACVRAGQNVTKLLILFVHRGSDVRHVKRRR